MAFSNLNWNIGRQNHELFASLWLVLVGNYMQTNISLKFDSWMLQLKSILNAAWNAVCTSHQTIKTKNAVLLKASDFNRQNFDEGLKRRIQGSF